MKFIVIGSSEYGAKLTYSVNGEAGAKNVKLDGPQMLIGQGAVSLLGAKPVMLEITNKLAGPKSVTVTILAGREATA